MFNVEDLTIKQAKEMCSLLGATFTGVQQVKSSNILESSIGEYVIVRSRNEGINAGYVIQADDTGIVLKDARRIWYHKPKDTKTAWYEGVAKTGLDSTSKVSCAIDKKYIIEDYSVTCCTEAARLSIMAHKSHES